MLRLIHGLLLLALFLGSYWAQAIDLDLVDSTEVWLSSQDGLTRAGFEAYVDQAVESDRGIELEMRLGQMIAKTAQGERLIPHHGLVPCLIPREALNMLNPNRRELLLFYFRNDTQAVVCENIKLSDGTFKPVRVSLPQASVMWDQKPNRELVIRDQNSEEIVRTQVDQIFYRIEFGETSLNHVATVLALVGETLVLGGGRNQEYATCEVRGRDAAAHFFSRFYGHFVNQNAQFVCNQSHKIRSMQDVSSHPQQIYSKHQVYSPVSNRIQIEDGISSTESR